MPDYTSVVRVAANPDDLWAWLAAPDAFQKLLPPNSGVKLVRQDPGLALDHETLFTMPMVPGVRGAWLARITTYEPPRRFVDTQIEGPFARWEHEHLVGAHPDGGATMTDRVTWRVRWWQGPVLADAYIRRQLEKLFQHRTAVLQRELGTP